MVLQHFYRYFCQTFLLLEAEILSSPKFLNLAMRIFQWTKSSLDLWRIHCLCQVRRFWFFSFFSFWYLIFILWTLLFVWNFPNMAKDICSNLTMHWLCSARSRSLFVTSFGHITSTFITCFLFGIHVSSSTMFGAKYDCMHTKDWAFQWRVREELFTLNSTGYNVAHQRILLREVCGEVHLFPFKLLFNAKPWKAKIRADAITLDKVQLPILRLSIYRLRMSLGTEFLEIKNSAVGVHISQDMSVLFTLQPFISPLKHDGYILLQSTLKHFFIQSGGFNKRLVDLHVLNLDIFFYHLYVHSLVWFESNRGMRGE